MTNTTSRAFAHTHRVFSQGFGGPSPANLINCLVGRNTLVWRPDKILKESSCPFPYFPKLEHSPVLTGFFSPVSPIFLSVTGEINFITPEGCGCDKGKFGLLHNTQDFLGGI